MASFATGAQWVNGTLVYPVARVGYLACFSGILMGLTALAFLLLPLWKDFKNDDQDDDSIVSRRRPRWHNREEWRKRSVVENPNFSMASK